MATILELGYQKHDCFHNLSYDICKPIYYEEWQSTDGVIKNSDCIKFTVKTEEDTDTFINCIRIIVLNHPTDDFKLMISRKIDETPKVTSVEFNVGDIQFTVS